MKLIIFTFLIFLYQVSFSQILVIDEVQKTDSANTFIGELSFSFLINNRSATSENENRLIGMNFESDLAYLSKRHLYLMISDVNYTYATDNPVIRTGYTHVRTNFLYQNNLSYEVFGQAQFDLGRGLQIRQLIGGGLKFKLSQNKNLRSSLGIGGMWENEVWNNPNDDSERNLGLFKSSNYITVFSRLNTNASFESTIYYQTGFDNSIDAFRHRLNFHGELNFKLSDVLTFEVEGSFAYENRPVVPILKYMYILENGISIEF